MSFLTGKCDFLDSCKMIGNIEDYLGDKAEIYVGDIRIPNETEKDLVPYYPFLISISCCSDGHRNVYLQRYSYIDYEEYDRLQRALDSFLRYYRKCKRNKTEFEFEEMLKYTGYSWGMYNDEKESIYRELYNRIIENPNKANIKGLSLPFYDKLFRKEFYELLLEFGFNEIFAYNWVYKRKDKLFYERHYNVD